MSRDILRVIAGFLNDLAAMTTGQTPLSDAKTKIAAMTEVLAADFPDERCYAKPVLYAAGREFKWFPSYAELSKFLGEWWEKNRPRHTELPRVNDPSLSAEERGHVQAWVNLKAEWQAAGRLENALATYRQWHAAFAYICRTDTDAAAIAVRRRWSLETPTQREHTDEEKAQVSERAAAAIAAMRGVEDIGSAVNRAVAAQAAALKKFQEERLAADVARQRDASAAVQKARAAVRDIPEDQQFPPPANDPAPLEGEIIPPDKPVPLAAAPDPRHLPWED